MTTLYLRSTENHVLRGLSTMLTWHQSAISWRWTGNAPTGHALRRLPDRSFQQCQLYRFRWTASTLQRWRPAMSPWSAFACMARVGMSNSPFWIWMAAITLERRRRPIASESILFRSCQVRWLQCRVLPMNRPAPLEQRPKKCIRMRRLVNRLTSRQPPRCSKNRQGSRCCALATSSS